MDKRAKDKLVRSPRENGGGQDAQKDLHSRTGRDKKRPRKRRKEEVERYLQMLRVRRWRELVADRKNRRTWFTDQSPQWAVVSMEEEEVVRHRIQIMTSLQRSIRYCPSG